MCGSRRKRSNPISNVVIIREMRDRPVVTARRPIRRIKFAVADRKMADRKMVDRKMADRKMADRKMADRKMADRKMADRKMADRNMADSEVKTSRLHSYFSV